MQILALERENSGLSSNIPNELLRKEARKVWELVQDQIIRGIWFQEGESLAVILLECSNAEVARERLSHLPLVSAGLIEFDLIPLVPYPGFARLFPN